MPIEIRWTENELENQSLISAANFRTRRLAEASDVHTSVYTLQRDRVTRFFTETAFLQDLDALDELITTDALTILRR